MKRSLLPGHGSEPKCRWLHTYRPAGWNCDEKIFLLRVFTVPTTHLPTAFFFNLAIGAMARSAGLFCRKVNARSQKSTFRALTAPKQSLIVPSH
jgi:hypothetical protein